MKLNCGCGRDIQEGWCNLDSIDSPGVDIVFDLESCRTRRIPLEDNSVDEFLLSHVIEHIHNVLPMMEELWRVAKPGAKMTIRVPHGASDDAWEDPTHVRPYFLSSFAYFAQPTYWRADYRFRGDWQPREITLVVDSKWGRRTPQEVMEAAKSSRNIVREMICELEAIKPAREQRQELQERPKIRLVAAE